MDPSKPEVFIGVYTSCCNFRYCGVSVIGLIFVKKRGCSVQQITMDRTVSLPSQPDKTTTGEVTKYLVNDQICLFSITVW